MKTLKFAPGLVPLVQNGSKTSTWRLFDDKDLTEGDLLSLVEKSNGQEFARAKITSVKEINLGNMTEEDKEGHEKFNSDEKMYETYSKYYGVKVDRDTLIKIVKFRLIS